MKSERYLSEIRCVVSRFVRVSQGKMAVERKVSVFSVDSGRENLRDLEIVQV